MFAGTGLQILSPEFLRQRPFCILFPFYMIISVFSPGQDGAAHCWEPGQLVLVSTGVLVLCVFVHAGSRIWYWDMGGTGSDGEMQQFCAVILCWGPSGMFWQAG